MGRGEPVNAMGALIGRGMLPIAACKRDIAGGVFSKHCTAIGHSAEVRMCGGDRGLAARFLLIQRPGSTLLNSMA